MAAPAAGLEEITVTLPPAVDELNFMRVVLAVKGHFQRFDPNAVSLFSVPLRFLDLADHAIVHSSNLLSSEILNKKGTARVPSISLDLACLFFTNYSHMEVASN
jgi:hypothetical protein